MGDDDYDDGEWTWRYSVWTGLMYGPIPVQLLVFLVIGVICFCWILK